MQPTIAAEWWLRAYTFVFYMVPALVVSNFPLYFADSGFTHTQIGFFFSIGPIVGIGASMIWGIISDRLQRATVLLKILICGQILALIGLFQAEGFWQISGWLTLFYFFQTPMVPLSDALTLFMIGDQKERYGSIRIMGSLGFAVAAVLVGIWLQKHGLEALPWLSLAIVSMALVLTWKLPERKGGMARPNWSTVRKTAANRSLWLFLFLVLILAIAHRVNDAFLALYVKELGGSASWIGWSWAAAAVSEIPFLLWTARAGERVGPLLILTVCALMYAIRFVLMSVAVDATDVFWIQWMHSVTFGLFLVTAIQAMVRYIPDALRASGQALLLVVWVNISGVITGNGGGWLETWIGFKGLYAVSAGLALFAAIGFGWMHRYASKKTSH